VTLAPLKQAG